MQNKNIKSSKQGHEDDCQDCRREKKQNQTLISIYQKLQAIDNNSKLMRKSLQKHKSQFEATHTKFKDFVMKFNRIPQESKADIELKTLGYDLAHTMMQQLTQGDVIKENQRLKITLARMNKQRSNSLSGQQPSARRSLSVSTNNQCDQGTSSLKREDPDLRRSWRKDCGDLIKSTCVEQIKQESEAEETRTTGFFSHGNKSRLDASKIEGMNLWLYEQNESKGMQQQLYETRLPSRYRINKASKCKASVLPALRATRHKI